jgi:hypothetical protein
MYTIWPGFVAWRPPRWHPSVEDGNPAGREIVGFSNPLVDRAGDQVIDALALVTVPGALKKLAP